jgi:hypothetical protein
MNIGAYDRMIRKREAVENYLKSRIAMNRIKEIAKEYNSRHRMCKKQCFELAKQYIRQWAETFVV